MSLRSVTPRQFTPMPGTHLMSTPYFLVHRVEVSAGFAFVEGRLGDAKIKKGHIFSRLYPRVEEWRAEKKRFEPCTFVLSGIEAYRHAFEELDAGMTARLRIEGENLSTLTAAKVLE